jgi:hypothetical protein
MKVLMFATVFALASVSAFAAETATKKVSHDVEHHHVDESADHEHDEAHHKETPDAHKAHHPSHDADAAKHDEMHKVKKVTK